MRDARVLDFSKFLVKIYQIGQYMTKVVKLLESKLKFYHSFLKFLVLKRVS